MRWSSNHESAAKGEVSIMAIIETLIAISISIGIANYFDTTLHILISACIAPFLLLRTEESTELGLKWFDWSADRLSSGVTYLDTKLGDHDGLILSLAFAILFLIYVIFLFFPLMAIASVLIKFFATLLSFIRKPITSITFIPRNWLRVTLCTDLAAPPEIITGIETSGDYNGSLVLFSGHINHVKSAISKRQFFWPAFSLIIVPLMFTAPSSIASP